MPRPAHTAVTWKGIFGSVINEVEKWQFTLRFDQVLDIPSDNGRNVIASGCASAYTTTLGPIMSQDIVFQACEVRSIGPDGLEPRNGAGEFTGQGFAEGSVPGGSQGLARLPVQTALVVSLNTPRAGASGKGRVFLPWPMLQLDAGFRISGADGIKVLDAFEDFVGVLNGGIFDPGSLSVASSKGFMSPVTGLRVGLAPDTQRSRRGDLDEQYLTRSLVAA